MPPAPASSTGLSSRTAAVLAYLAWWVTGLIFCLVERRDGYVRFHAAQAVAVFGVTSVCLGLQCLLAALSLSFFPAVFTFLVILVLVTWAAAMVVWGIALFKAWHGEAWRIPGTADLADRVMNARVFGA